MSGPSQNFSSSALQDVISEESPPAYTPYPNSGERSMAFGPSRAFGETPQQPSLNSASQYPTACSPGIVPPASPLMQPQITAIHYPPGFTCAVCNNTGYERQSVACQQCVSSFGVPADNSYSGMYQPGFSTFSSGGVIYARPGDPNIGGQLCTSCKGSGTERILFEIILCPKCQGVGRVFK